MSPRPVRVHHFEGLLLPAVVEDPEAVLDLDLHAVGPVEQRQVLEAQVGTSGAHRCVEGPVDDLGVGPEDQLALLVEDLQGEDHALEHGLGGVEGHVHRQRLTGQDVGAGARRRDARSRPT